MKTLYESLIDRTSGTASANTIRPTGWRRRWQTGHRRRSNRRCSTPPAVREPFSFMRSALFLAEAEESEWTPARCARRGGRHVAGIDIHPVAVIIARVTYSRARAGARARARALTFRSISATRCSSSIIAAFRPTEADDPRAPPRANGSARQTISSIFRNCFCRDPDLFDKAIEKMRAVGNGPDPRAVRAGRAAIAALHRSRTFPNPTSRFGEEELRGRRTSARPISSPTGCAARAGTPSGPMSPAISRARSPLRRRRLGERGDRQSALGRLPPHERRSQKRFKELAKGARRLCRRQVRHAKRPFRPVHRSRGVALSARFGRLAFVLPLAVLTRGQFERLRSASSTAARSWDEAWTMDDSVQPLFPVPSCAVFGRRRATSKPFPNGARLFRRAADARRAGSAGGPAHRGGQVQGDGERGEADGGGVSGGSIIEGFRQGATLVPRMCALSSGKRSVGSGPMVGAPGRAAAALRKSSRGRICPASRTRSRRNFCARPCSARASAVSQFFGRSRRHSGHGKRRNARLEAGA